MKRQLSLAAFALIAFAAPLGAAAPATAVTPHAAPSAATYATCEDAAAATLASNGIDPSDLQFDYTCGGGTVNVGGDLADGTEVLLAGTATLVPETSARSNASDGNASIQATNCVYAEPTRTIISELEVFMTQCVIYGREPAGDDPGFTRTIITEWTLFTGWPSAESIVTTIPSEGAPILTGTIMPRKQNGVLPPTNLNGFTAFQNVGNDTTSGYNVGSFSSGGAYSVQMEALYVQDAEKNFDLPSSTVGVVTPRFECDSEQLRCFYPNGAESPVLG